MNITNLVNQQRTHYLTGSTLPLTYRISALKRIGQAVDEMEHEIVTALGKDLNKSSIEAFMTEIGTLKAELKLIRSNITKWNKQKPARTPIGLFPAKCSVVPEPYGVVLIMSPWNYPFMLTMVPLIGAIAAGNCVVIKPSAYAPATSRIIRKLITRCFKECDCAVVEGNRKETSELLEQQFDYIFFTGSVSVGKVVMTAAAKRLTPVTLELGGKSPVIVDESAKIDLAAKRLVFSKYMNAGQTCVAPDYVMVHRSKESDLLKALKKYIDICYPKDPAGNVMDYPRIINTKHFLRIVALMEGEDAAIGGVVDEHNLTIEPTVLKNVSLTAPIMQEEIFGPILPIIVYDNLNEVINEIRRRPKPLALYLFSQDKVVWRRIEQTISFGGCCINDCMLQVASPYLPFGGVGDSGMGQYHGKASFDTFTHYKGIVNKGTKLDFPIRYRPYDSSKENMIRKM